MVSGKMDTIAELPSLTTRQTDVVAIAGVNDAFHIVWDLALVAVYLAGVVAETFVDLGGLHRSVHRHLQSVGYHVVHLILTIMAAYTVFALLDASVRRVHRINQRRFRGLHAKFPYVAAHLNGCMAAAAMRVVNAWLIATVAFFLVLHIVVRLVNANVAVCVFVLSLLSLGFIYFSALRASSHLSRIRFEFFRVSMQAFYAAIPLMMLATFSVVYTTGTIIASLQLYLMRANPPEGLDASWIASLGDIRWLWELDLYPLLVGSAWAAIASWFLSELWSAACVRDWRRGAIFLGSVVTVFVASEFDAWSEVVVGLLPAQPSLATAISSIVLAHVATRMIEKFLNARRSGWTCPDATCERRLSDLDAFCSLCGAARPSAPDADPDGAHLVGGNCGI